MKKGHRRKFAAVYRWAVRTSVSEVALARLTGWVATAAVFADVRRAALRRWLAGYSSQFVAVVAEKLLTYALGRGVEYQDMPEVRSIVRAGAARDNRFSALVLAIVKSRPFQMNMSVDPAVARNDGASR